MAKLSNISLYICILMTKIKERVSMSVSIPAGLVSEIDHLVAKKVFGSRSEALRYGARLAILFQKRVHFRAEEYAYEETKSKVKSDTRVS